MEERGPGAGSCAWLLLLACCHCARPAPAAATRGSTARLWPGWRRPGQQTGWEGASLGHWLPLQAHCGDWGRCARSPQCACPKTVACLGPQLDVGRHRLAARVGRDEKDP